MLRWYLCRYSLSGMPWLVGDNDGLMIVVQEKEREKKGDENDN